MFSKFSIAAVSALGLVAASPALATGKNNDPSGTPANQQVSPNAKTRYCVQAKPVTGTILQGRTCKTASQWRAEGIDVTKLAQRN